MVAVLAPGETAQAIPGWATATPAQPRPMTARTSTTVTTRTTSRDGRPTPRRPLLGSPRASEGEDPKPLKLIVCFAPVHGRSERGQTSWGTTPETNLWSFHATAFVPAHARCSQLATCPRKAACASTRGAAPGPGSGGGSRGAGPGERRDLDGAAGGHPGPAPGSGAGQPAGQAAVPAAAVPEAGDPGLGAGAPPGQLAEAAGVLAARGLPLRGMAAFLTPGPAGPASAAASP